MGRARRDFNEVMVVIWFPDKSIEWTISGRPLVPEFVFQPSSSLLARMRVCIEGNIVATEAISSALRSVSARPRYRMLGNFESELVFWML